MRNLQTSPVRIGNPVMTDSEVTLPPGIFELDSEGLVMAYNTYSSNLQSKPKTDVIGHSFFGELLEPTCRTLEDRFRHVLRERVPFSRLNLRETAADGQSVLLMFFPDSQSVMIQIDKARNLSKRMSCGRS